MKVLLAASEAVPYAKTGGLADVAGSLADALSHAGLDVMLVLPLYKGIMDDFSPLPVADPVGIKVGDVVEQAQFHSLTRDSGAQVVFVGNSGFFERDELYATSSGEYPDNDRRFVFFSKAVFEAAKAAGFSPDVIHCNDWQSALVPVYMKTSYRWDFPAAVSVLTIHNLGYQGHFPPESMPLTGLPYEFYTPGVMEFYGKVNFLKAGILFADTVTTVSEQYSREILEPEFGFGLDGVLRDRSGVISGITNGIDQTYWDPSSDNYLPATFSVAKPGGKEICRTGLIEEVSFDQGPAPVAGMVGRLSGQKGMDILIKALPGLFGKGFRLVVLGKGDDEIQDSLLSLEEKYPRNMHLRLDFDEPFAHLVYAGSDLFIMPSRYEPCGLAQMISMRYATPPVVHATGGLVDTVTDASDPGGTGFIFKEYTPEALSECIWRAVDAMDDKAAMEALKARCMARDFSWGRSARKYIDLYKEVRKGVRG